MGLSLSYSYHLFLLQRFAVQLFIAPKLTGRITTSLVMTKSAMGTKYVRSICRASLVVYDWKGTLTSSHLSVKRNKTFFLRIDFEKKYPEECSI